MWQTVPVSVWMRMEGARSSVRQERVLRVGATILTEGWGPHWGGGALDSQEEQRGIFGSKSSTRVPPFSHRVANSFERMGQKKAAPLFFFNRGKVEQSQGWVYGQQCPIRLCIVLVCNSCIWEKVSEAILSDFLKCWLWPEEQQWITGALLLLIQVRSSATPATTVNVAFAPISLYFKSYFLIVSGFHLKLDIAIYLPAKFKDC